MPNIKNESGFPASTLTAICPCHCTLDWCIMHHDYGDAPDTENCYQQTLTVSGYAHVPVLCFWQSVLICLSVLLRLLVLLLSPYFPSLTL